MCGIAGIVTFERVEGSLQQRHAAAAQDELQALLLAMKHRGPDATGMCQCSPGVFLGCNRLRITDAANPEADLPLTSPDGRITIAFNGEVYNHLKVRSDIQAVCPERQFDTLSDAETVLTAYETWGLECVSRFEGMFAIVVYDGETKETHIATDPTGQRTMYVHRELNGIAFASEIEALIADDHRVKHWDKAALREYISQRYIIGSQTHIVEITKVEPGTTLTIYSDGRCECRRYYQVPLGNQARQDVNEIRSDIKLAVKQAVCRTTHLEVDHALLLSGGIDSSSVLSHLQEARVRPKTYTVGFRAALAGCDSETLTRTDVDYSRVVAEHFGTAHHARQLTAEEYCTYLDMWAQYCGEPLGSQEAPCLIELMERVAVSGAKVVFTGSGPDEVFDGYSYGHEMAATSTLGSLAKDYINCFQWAGEVDFDRLVPNTKWRLNLTRKYEDILGLYRDQSFDVLQAVQLMHFHGRLVSYECRQLDVIGMRHSLETRAPLLDRDIIKVAFDFDPSLKQKGSEKAVFKEALRGVVPDVIVDRQKAAFPIPEAMWFSHAFEKRAQILFEDGTQLTKERLVDASYMRALWREPRIGARNIFSRLYTLEKIMRRQAEHVESGSLSMESCFA